MRFPLYAKILLWFFLNLIALGAAGWIAFGGRLHPPGLDTLLAGPMGDRVQSVSELIASELHSNSPDQWDAVLKRFDEAYHVRFFLFRSDGTSIAGGAVELPGEVKTQLREHLPQFRPQGGPPMSHHEFGHGGMPPMSSEGPPGVDAPDQQRQTHAGPPGPPPLPPGDQRPPRPAMLRTVNPVQYWVLIRIPAVLLKQAAHPEPCMLVIASDTITGGGLFFDPAPWLAIGAGTIFFSALLWFPLVHGITRSLGKMTRATEQIAEGRFDVRLADKRRDELGSLGAAINRMAARLSGFVGGQKRFLGDIAHELCSPLARAQMALGILEQRGDETQHAYVSDVREEIELMSSLVNELLSFSKASLGAKIQLQPALLRPIVEKAAQRESDNDKSVEIDIPEDLRVMAEPELLLRSLSNLVRNAIHYAGHAGPVKISASEHGGKAVITVLDNGGGVPPEALAQVFDPFYRVDPSRARETGGAGLGLAIVKTCVESCGGSVTARNREPNGFEVIITLQAVPV